MIHYVSFPICLSVRTNATGFAANQYCPKFDAFKNFFEKQLISEIINFKLGYICSLFIGFLRQYLIWKNYFLATQIAVCLRSLFCFHIVICPNLWTDSSNRIGYTWILSMFFIVNVYKQVSTIFIHVTQKTPFNILSLSVALIIFFVFNWLWHAVCLSKSNSRH